MRRWFISLGVTCCGFVAGLNAFPAAARTVIPAREMPRCCQTYEEIKHLDGRRVWVEGVYERTNVTKRRHESAPQQSGRSGAGPVQILCSHQVGVMLGIYYDATGTRSADEVKRFEGRRVAVAGTLHLATPTQRTPEGIELQTMIGPYLSDISSIELVP
ncbi:MAG: hypothetical protein HY696_04490 [Deltaproteobacteria bacterium]|nr:hypothetical protein [Deltaproteobacteria bacterium]